MILNFAAALSELKSGSVFRIANEARPPSDYLFETLLPEEARASYRASAGNMIVRSTMAGLVGMDSPYPPSGMVESSTFDEATAKVANHVPLTEAAIRELQTLLGFLSGQATSAAASVNRVQEEALNFLDKVIIQAHLDTAEYLRGEALTFGNIDWTFNQKRLQVSYGFPAAHFLTARTGTASYYNTASAFWTDVRTARKLLKQNLSAVIAHTDTINDIVYNDANKARVIGEDGLGGFTLQRYSGTTEQPTGDARDTVRIIGYDREGEILDTVNLGKTILVPFMSRGKVLFVGKNTRSGYRVGEGSTDDPDNALRLGYTHIAPTVEGGGAPGRWAELFTPELAPWSLHGRGVTNLIPVIESNDKVVIGTTDMAP